MLKIKNTSIKKRYNIIDESIPGHDDDHYVRQVSKEELINIIKSGVDALCEVEE